MMTAATSSQLDSKTGSRQPIAAAHERSPIAKKRTNVPAMLFAIRLLIVLFLAGLAPAVAQDAAAPAPAPDTDTLDPTPPGTLHPQPLPPLANPNAPST